MERPITKKNINNINNKINIMAKKNVNPETKVACPVCGTEFAIPEHEHISIGIAIAKDSGLGTVYPSVADAAAPLESTNTTNNQTPAQMKAEAKIEALRKAGINVDNLFSMKGATGQETIARLENGNLTIVPDDDPIFAAIIGRGTVPNRRLFRRWVMSQVFHMLSYRGYYGDEGFVAALQNKGYKYQWKMVLEELRVQVKLAESDAENFAARNRWFNKNTVNGMCHDYIVKLHSYVDELTIRHCKGIPYIRIKRIDIFCSDFYSKIFVPLERAAAAVEKAATPWKLYQATSAFITLAKKWWMPYDVTMSTIFKDAYKGAGAYFTMKNLILFHGASFKNGCVKLSQQKSLRLLEDKAKEYESEGWRLFGLMKKLINDSNIDIEKKMAEWCK